MNNSISTDLKQKYIVLRKKFNTEEYRFLFSEIPGLEDLDSEIEKAAIEAEKEQILDLRGEYWNFASFIFQKMKKKSIMKKWTKEQYNAQFGVCAICKKPISNVHNARVEHIVSRRNFGSNYSDNLILVHSNCKRKNGSDIEVDRSKIQENRFSERLDEYVSDLTADMREEYPVKFPDQIFDGHSPRK